MKKSVWIKFFLMFIVVSLSGCYPYYYGYQTPQSQPNRYRATYDISLFQVERPAKAKARYGSQKIDKIIENGISKYYYEDKMIKIVWLPVVEQLSFVIYNKTEYSIRIVWDEAAYVDENGSSHRVMHQGVKYADRNNSQPPSVIVRTGSIEDFIVPTDYVYWREGFYEYYTSIPGGWETKPLFANVKEGYGTAEGFLNALNPYLGKTFQVLLPLQIEDVINDYIFTFKIDNVSIKGYPELSLNQKNVSSMPTEDFKKHMEVMLRDSQNLYGKVSLMVDKEAPLGSDYWFKSKDGKKHYFSTKEELDAILEKQ